MSEIKPVYQVQTFEGRKWEDCEKDFYESILKNNPQLSEVRILYTAAAYEALQKQNKAHKLMCDSKTSQLEIAEKEVARLRSLDTDNKGLKECNSILTSENEALQKANAELKYQIKQLKAPEHQGQLAIDWDNDCGECTFRCFDYPNCKCTGLEP